MSSGLAGGIKFGDDLDVVFRNEVTKNELAFDLDSFRESGIREFRLGQRVKFLVEGEPPRAKVRDLTIVSF